MADRNPSAIWEVITLALVARMAFEVIGVGNTLWMVVVGLVFGLLMELT